MGYQFMHIEPFGREGAHRKNSSARKPSMQDICAEMIREPHACPHVTQPLEAKVIFGITPQQAVALADERAAQAVDGKNRKLRVDASVILVGIASWPESVAKISNDRRKQKRYRDWRGATIAWLKRRWGDDFKTAVEHLDEPYPHIHFVIVPKVGADRRLRIADIHPGHHAAAKRKSGGGGARDQRKAYKAAMVALQDDYYEHVGAQFGLTRIGPRRQRLNRSEWTEQQRQAEALAGQHTKVQILATSVAASAKAHVTKKAKEITEAARTQIEAVRAQSVRDISMVQEKVTECVKGLRTQVKQLNRELSEKEAIIAQQAADLASLAALLSEIRPAPR